MASTRPSSRKRPLEAAAEVEEAPARAADDALGGQPGEGHERRARPRCSESRPRANEVGLGRVGRRARRGGRRAEPTTRHVPVERYSRTEPAEPARWARLSARRRRPVTQSAGQLVGAPPGRGRDGPPSRRRRRRRRSPSGAHRSSAVTQPAVRPRLDQLGRVVGAGQQGEGESGGGLGPLGVAPDPEERLGGAARHRRCGGRSAAPPGRAPTSPARRLGAPRPAPRRPWPCPASLGEHAACSSSTTRPTPPGSAVQPWAPRRRAAHGRRPPEAHDHRARHDGLVAQHRRRAERHLRLGDEALGLGRDRGEPLRPLAARRGGRRTPTDTAVALVSWSTRSVELVSASARCSGSPSQSVGSDGQPERLAEQQLARRGEVGVEGDVAGDARVPMALATPTPSLARMPPAGRARRRCRRLRPELERIGVGVVDAPEHDVDRLQPGQGPQPHPAAPHGQVGPLDEVVAEVAGQVGVLEVAGVADARRQHHGPGVAAVGRGERAPASWRSCVKKPPSRSTRSVAVGVREEPA